MDTRPGGCRRVDDARRGDLVTVAVAGDFGKPRPALVIQSDQFDTTATVTVLLVSSTLVEAPLIRLTVEPSARNGLRERSQVMVDKAMTVKRDKLGSRLGRLDNDALVAISRALALFLGFAWRLRKPVQPSMTRRAHPAGCCGHAAGN